MKLTNTKDIGQMVQRIDELETRNAKLEEVLEAAKRILRSRSRLDDPMLMQLDQAVNTIELHTEI